MEIISDPVVIWSLIFIILSGSIIAIRIFSKKYNIDLSIQEEVVAEAREEAQDNLIEAIKAKKAKKERLKKPPKVIILLAFLASLSACQYLTGLGTTTFKMNGVEVTWESEKSFNSPPIDSIRIYNAPVYFISKPIVKDTLNPYKQEEIQFVKDGYSIWLLKNEAEWRIEVKKIDTVIYIFKKK